MQQCRRYGELVSQSLTRDEDYFRACRLEATILHNASCTFNFEHRFIIRLLHLDLFGRTLNLRKRPVKAHRHQHAMLLSNVVISLSSNSNRKCPPTHKPVCHARMIPAEEQSPVVCRRVSEFNANQSQTAPCFPFVLVIHTQPMHLHLQGESVGCVLAKSNLLSSFSET